MEAQEAMERLKETFCKIFDDEERKASGLVDSFMRRVKNEGNDAFGNERARKERYLAEVALKLYDQYPGDIGLFGALSFANLAKGSLYNR